MPVNARSSGNGPDGTGPSTHQETRSIAAPLPLTLMTNGALIVGGSAVLLSSTLSPSTVTIMPGAVVSDDITTAALSLPLRLSQPLKWHFFCLRGLPLPHSSSGSSLLMLSASGPRTSV